MTTLRRPDLDRFAMMVSGLCVVHCLATAMLIALASAVGGLLGDPRVHEFGLVLAIGLAMVALGRGVVAHRRVLPALVGLAGIVLMGCALAIPHGAGETLWTIAGVTLLAAAHWCNRRYAAIAA